MNNLPSVDDLLGLLDALKKAVHEFAGREEKLEADYRVGTAAELRDFQTRNEAQEAAAVGREAGTEAQREMELARCQARFAQRKERINRIHAALSRRVFEQISAADEHWRERTQQRVQDAERARDTALAAATAADHDLRARLEAAGQTLAELEISLRRAFRGYRQFRRLLAPGPTWPEPDTTPDANGLLAGQLKLHEKIRDRRAAFGRQPLPRLFQFLPVWLPVAGLLGVAATDPTLHLVSHLTAGMAAGGAVLLVILHFLGGKMAAAAAHSLAGDLAQAGRLFDVCAEKAAAELEQEQARVKNEFEATRGKCNLEWRQAVRDTSARRAEEPAVVDNKAARVTLRNERQQEAARDRLQQHHDKTLAKLKTTDLGQTWELAAAHQERMQRLVSEHQHRWQELELAWQNRLQPLCEQLRAVNAAEATLCPEWSAAAWQNWMPPAKFQNAARFARLVGSVEKFAGPLPKDPRLKWFGPATLSVPLSLACPQQGSMLFESGKTSGDEAFGAINNIIFRLLAATPPGKLSFTIFDPVGLGQNFAALTHLADYEESSLNSRIWTQTTQFEERLAELNEHMEKIIQMYLRNDYATIADYNAEAGSVAEKYHFLVIASFPVNFSETAAKRLRNIAANGARCGVYTLIHWDQRTAAPADFVPDELRQNSICLVRTENGFDLAGGRTPGLRLILDTSPPAEFATEFLRRLGELSKHSTRVEVPFETVAPAELWMEDTSEQLQVPIGRSGATKFQLLEIGRGTRQHALLAGKTGSGKSTLFHVIITNLALRCSPAQVEFYLVDFKKGVEFKCYGSRHLPHAKVVAIESDREFGLSVLQRVDEELRRRGDLFRRAGAQDLPGYKRAGGTEPMPRTLLMIDEFQEFFTEEDRVSQGAAVLLDRIVRQGRAFGIHVLLGSQTLGGAYTLARATLGQMVIRIALQCNEADAYLIMDQDNPAPRLLSRPGEGIYNDAAGAIEGNSPFQAVWISDRTRDTYLAQIRTHADQLGNQYPGPIVFEGNAPADVQENYLLREVLKAGQASRLPRSASDQEIITPASLPRAGEPPALRSARTWLGAPNSIKGPTEAKFQRQSGSHLLVVGQSEERTATLLAVALVALAAQFPKGGAEFVVLDSTPPGFPQREMMDRLIQSAPHQTVSVGNATLAEVMATLATELARRADNEATGPEIFVLVQGLQNFKKLRAEDEFSFSSSSSGPTPAGTLMSLVTEGPARGIHLIITCDTYNNVNRFLGRKALTEFEMRVVFQMSAGDSASLIDSPAAATLGLHRALLYNDREGSLETFRPYAQPGSDWVEEVLRSW